MSTRTLPPGVAEAKARYCAAREVADLQIPLSIVRLLAHDLEEYAREPGADADDVTIWARQLKWMVDRIQQENDETRAALREAGWIDADGLVLTVPWPEPEGRPA